MDVTSIIDSLNPAQREAVTSADPYQLVLAGAGSGKTRVLVHRIAWLMQVEGLSPYQILAVTFTNKAAREMRERISSLIGFQPQGMWVGTFHGLAHRLLKMHWRDAGLPEGFQILDADDQLRVIKRVYTALNMDTEKWPPRQAQWYINEQKDEGLRAAHIQQSPDPFSVAMLQIYRGYEEACQRGGLVDFGELLLRAHELWLNKPELLAHYQDRFQHILVDEFQDTNSIQYAWLRVLAGNKLGMTAVGDDDQSIYGWRGAKIENIQNYTHDFEGVTTVRLEQNYRSTATILKAANGVISQNANRLGKTLWTDGEDGEMLSLYAGFNEQDEARFIGERIQDWIAKGNMRSDVAILYRSNAQSRILEEALLRLQIPYRIYGGHRFYERLEIKNALAYLRLLMNRHDDAAFERVINTPTRGIGDKTVQRLRDTARAANQSLWAAAESEVENLPARASNAVRGFLAMVVELAEDYQSLTLDGLTDQVLEASGLLEFYRREKGERGQTRVENLEELINACRAYEAPDPDTPALPQFIDEAVLDAGERQAESDEDAIQLMTLHSAKGLEFPLVFMAGMEENLFPHKMSLEESGRLEEERRLCYVGITRAMERLYLTYAETRRLYGQESFNRVSRFIRDIPSDVLQEVRLSANVSRPTSFVKKPATLSDEGTGSGLALGQQVKHKIFGEGVILSFEGNGPNGRVQVNFANEGTKWMVLQYAKLQPA